MHRQKRRTEIEVERKNKSSSQKRKIEWEDNKMSLVIKREFKLERRGMTGRGMEEYSEDYGE